MNTKQIRAVFQTWYRRPMIWWCSGDFVLALAFICFGPTGNSRTRVAPEFDRWNRAIHVTDGKLTSAYTIPPRLEEYYSVDYAQGNEAVPITIEQYPNLQSIQFDGAKITTADADRIAAHEQLRDVNLHLSQPASGTLRRLRLKLTSFHGDLATLQLQRHDLHSLSRLKWVEIIGNNEVDEIIDVVNSLPAIRSLVLPQQPFHDANMNQWQRLQEHPTLKNVFVSEYAFEHTIASTQVEQFKPLRLMPMDVSQRWVMTLWSGPITAMLLWGVIAIQLYSQFVPPTSRVVPKYAGPHRLVALIIGIPGTVLVAWAMTQVGFYAFLPSLTTLFFVPTIIPNLLQAVDVQSRVIKSLQLMFGVVIGLSVYALPSIVFLIPGELFWYLQGHRPAWTMIILLIEILGAMISFKRLHQMAPNINEQHATLPPLSIAEQQQSSNANWAKAVVVGSRLGMLQEQKLQYHGNVESRMVQTWRRGNLLKMSAVIKLIIVITALIIVGDYLLHTIEFGTLSYLPQTLEIVPLMAGFMIGEMLIILPITAWSQRIQQMGSQSLYPVDRTRLAKQMFSSMMADQWPGFLLVTLLSLFHICWMTDRRWEYFVLFFVILGSMGIWFHAISLTVLACRSRWYWGGIAGLMFVTPFLLLWIVIVQTSHSTLSETGTMVAYGSIPALCGLLGLICIPIFRRWTREREWG